MQPVRDENRDFPEIHFDSPGGPFRVPRRKRAIAPTALCIQRLLMLRLARRTILSAPINDAGAADAQDQNDNADRF